MCKHGCYWLIEIRVDQWKDTKINLNLKETANMWHLHHWLPLLKIVFISNTIWRIKEVGMFLILKVITIPSVVFFSPSGKYWRVWTRQATFEECVNWFGNWNKKHGIPQLEIMTWLRENLEISYDFNLSWSWSR